MNIQTINQPESIALSHVNIIVDIYNKCHNHNVPQQEMKNFLQNIIQDNEIDPFFNTNNLRTYNPRNPPSIDLLNAITSFHQEIGKGYQKNGNNWDYSFDELIHMIKWIALQEDINYPILLHKQGRRMPFARYLEAIWVSGQNEHTVFEVIQRALDHALPRLWVGYDYELLLYAN